MGSYLAAGSRRATAVTLRFHAQWSLNCVAFSEETPEDEAPKRLSYRPRLAAATSCRAKTAYNAI